MTILIVSLAIAVIATVAVGFGGVASKGSPELTEMLTKLGHHLDGEADAPDVLIDFLEEIPTAGDLTSPDGELRQAKAVLTQSKYEIKAVSEEIRAVGDEIKSVVGDEIKLVTRLPIARHRKRTDIGDARMTQDEPAEGQEPALVAAAEEADAKLATPESPQSRAQSSSQIPVDEPAADRKQPESAETVGKQQQ